MKACASIAAWVAIVVSQGVATRGQVTIDVLAKYGNITDTSIRAAIAASKIVGLCAVWDSVPLHWTRPPARPSVGLFETAVQPPTQP
jgi:hypothetical protein